MTTRTAFDGTEMSLRRSEACRECIGRYIGPALETIGEAVETPRSAYAVVTHHDGRTGLPVVQPAGTPIGCCSREGTRYSFTYWYPWPDSDE